MKIRSGYHIIIFFVLLTMAPSKGWAQDKHQNRQKERDMIIRMFHYCDSFHLQPDSITSNVYERHHYSIVKRNPLLMCVPSLYHVSYGKDREFLTENYSTITFYKGKVVSDTRQLELSSMKRYRRTMPNLLTYLMPNIYNETMFRGNVLSPFYYSNRFFYKYSAVFFHDGTASIRFRPRTFNTQTVRGTAIVDCATGRVISTHFEGEYDMINFIVDVRMGDEGYASLLPAKSSLNARFSLLGNRLIAKHQAHFNRPSILPDTLFDSHDPVLMSLVRPDSLTEQEKELYAKREESRQQQNREKEQEEETPSKNNFIKDVLWDKIGDHILNRTKGNFGVDDRGWFRISPLLNPLYLEYSNRHGFTYRFDVRGAYDFNDNQELYTRIKLGYAFKVKQLYFNMPVEYTFDKKHGGLVKLEFGFGHRISNGEVAQHVLDVMGIEEWQGNGDIDDFKDSKIDINGHYDISDYWSVEVGASYHRRTAGNRKVYKALGVRASYRSFAPNIELQYRPLGWNGPAITADYERGITGILRSENNYERWEFDVSHIFDMPSLRFLSLRAGCGFYSTSVDKYNFVDYSNFRENNLPGGWNDEWSGEFELLSRKWYNTSSYYLRANATYESPLMAISWLPFFGHFIEKERLYLGFLKTEHLKHYEEIGYGFTNRVFSFGFFTAFSEGKYDSMGLRFGFELFSDW